MTYSPIKHGVLVQAAWERYKPQPCKDLKCSIGTASDSAGELYMRHNDEHLHLPRAWIDDPTKDIWGDEVKPWLQSRHETSEEEH